MSAPTPPGRIREITDQILRTAIITGADLWNLVEDHAELSPGEKAVVHLVLGGGWESLPDIRVKQDLNIRFSHT
jgi:hypothetical protein